MNPDTKQEVKELQPIDESKYFSYINKKDLNYLIARRAHKYFNIILPSEKFSSDIKHLQTRLYGHFEAIEITNSYKLTKEAINEAYRCNLIVFEYGNTYISGINCDNIQAFKKACIEKLREQNIAEFDESKYFKNLRYSELSYYKSLRKASNFKFVLPSEEVNIFSWDIGILRESLYRHNEVIEINESYNLTEEDIIIAYRCNLIVFQYGDIFISGIKRNNIETFIKNFVKRIRKQNIAEAEKSKAKSIK